MATFVGMNIIKHTLSALAATAIAVSCTIGTIDNKQLVTREFTATLSPQTRTSLADGGKVLWDTEGESISIIAGDGECYTLTQKSVSTDRRSATFTGSVPSEGCVYAVYPSIVESGYDSGLVTLSIPTIQEARPDSFDTGSNIAISPVKEGSSLYFQNICGLIGITVNAEDITSIRLSADETSGGAITGSALVEHDGSAPFCVSDIDKGSPFVELEGDIQSGQRYYALAFPGTYGNLELTVTDSKGRTATFPKKESIKIERSKVLNINPITIPADAWTGGEEPGGTASLTYAEIANPKDYVKGYGSPTTYTNDFGSWEICAYDVTGAFQLNKDKVAYIGSPAMQGAITSVVITQKADGRSGNFIIGTNSSVSGSTVTGPYANAGTFTYDVSELNTNKIYIKSSALAHITAVTIVWGGGSFEPEPGPDPEPEQPQPNPDPNAKADYGWFELPAQSDKNADGIDDANTDYYYSHTFRADAPRIRNFSCCYSKGYMQPVWVAAPMHSCYKGNSGRNDSYKPDPKIKCEQASKVEGYTRGHMLGSSDRTVSKETNRQVFYYSNIGAQLQTGFNTGGGAWNNLESLTDGQWCSDTLYQVIGCIFTRFTDRYGKTVEPRKVGDVQIPTAYYKVLLRTKNGNTGKKVNQCSASELKCAAFILGHRANAGHKPTASDMYTVSELESITGLNYFVNVPNAPKSTATASDWNL